MNFIARTFLTRRWLARESGNVVCRISNSVTELIMKGWLRPDCQQLSNQLGPSPWLLNIYICIYIYGILIYIVFLWGMRVHKYSVHSILLSICYGGQSEKLGCYVVVNFLKDTYLSFVSLSPNTTLYCLPLKYIWFWNPCSSLCFCHVLF